MITQARRFSAALFGVLETQNILENEALRVDVVPAGAPLMYTLGTAAGLEYPPSVPRGTLKK